ncbi:MAG: Peptidyl-tRNA hydrolase [candidate division WS6 bacterium GW2011_GWD1_35_594]|uniref:Peptidyl-tRNA hydrolase n=1 Tax=candidate division WS6 bacterium GW2011_GWB1_33_6 TaxID=1619088 RepID=A0A0G0ATM8_9BACT|nr:MAG: peptidyl-tRNA hydrolase, peptidyl-tRNA hydrolase, PTH1 family [candidate division WS6 bacterium GW2011_GWF1_33_233]KKP54801.1 MAG: Peptidyl-tRNA hydrolase [candidate division WS6 bacterium GW2011_GWB1_33_6]KKP54992.1 MAG: peptidyl-tRNA hydrolase, peptidyl-tRNA hydrolase, PTH1 family [candidate division WS6 bacterium GW2011_WS6_33_547]KKP82250.1 MAG: Peptidyl-tRNA hydrolase [candidate division WS6 bacterium GW2011_GWD1_35_594]HBB64645.1 aminoacyl-tRNA hydrolase [Patescibacteria group bac
MFIVTGLGNPGKQYENTPHNAGFIALNSLREYLIQNTNYQVSEREDESKIFFSEICKVKKAGELIGILQKPLTYMNNSGSAVKLLKKKFPTENFVLIHDDLDIPLGKYKIQEGKSPKGHNGVLSVENSLSRNDFLRVRIGIENRGERLIPGEEYVLIPYNKKELEILKSTIQNSIEELFIQIEQY